MSYRNQLTNTEKELWDKATALFIELLDDFHSKNLLRKGTLQMDRERLVQLWKNSRKYGMAVNVVVEKLKSRERAEDLAQKCQQVGLTKETLSSLFMSQMLGTYLINLESIFKTSLLFFLEEECGIQKNMTLGQLLKVIKDISPSVGKKLQNMIDTELRNCLVHGTFWFKGDKVFLANNSYLEDVKEIQLYELFIEFKKANIIAISFIEALNQKINQHYFRL